MSRRASSAAQRARLEQVEILGKMNGAVGNFNAHVAALPQVDWPAFSAGFVESLGLDGRTPIHHANRAARLDCRILSCRSCAPTPCWWILRATCGATFRFGYFRQRLIEGEVGSSTMPHKVNPIDFENAEGNLGYCECLLGFFADKLPSRGCSAT
jgi:adenylosuccinate lyase